MRIEKRVKHPAVSLSFQEGIQDKPPRDPIVPLVNPHGAQ
jgi:hypothetical protein